MEAPATTSRRGSSPRPPDDPIFGEPPPGDLAPWWSLISPVEACEAEAAWIATLLHSAAVPVGDLLELGSGGGQLAAHLKRHFRITMVDRSPQLVRLSRRLNPRCRHTVGDLRSVRLGTRFDAVLVRDVIDSVTTEDDLRAAVATAHAHCRPGGIAVFVPGHVRETFEPGSDHGGSDGADGRSARFVSWRWDPDPADHWVVTQYALLLRHADGTVEVAQVRQRTGLFARDVWLDVLREAGFDASAVEEDVDEDRPPRTLFVGHRPRD